MKIAPRFSFVIPVFNGEQTLPSTLASITRQGGATFEIIVVDNGSTDGTKRVSQGFSGAKYVHCGNRGRSRARNYGARLARGDFLAFVDADVILAPDWLEAVDRYLSRLPLDALATRVVPRAEGDSSLDRYRRQFAQWKSRGTFLSVRSRAGAYPLINTAACIVRRNAFERVGGFDESLKRHEDLDLSFRLFLTGFLLGGISSARAEVRFMEEGSWLMKRELQYLRRALEVQDLSLFGGIQKPVNVTLLRAISHGRCLKTTAFAALVEGAWQVGGLKAHLRRSKPPVYPVTSGRNLLMSFFLHRENPYFLKRGLTFLWIDQAVYLCAGPFVSKRLPSNAARGVNKLISGLSLAPKDYESLLATKAFSPGAKVEAIIPSQTPRAFPTGAKKGRRGTAKPRFENPQEKLSSVPNKSLRL